MLGRWLAKRRARDDFRFWILDFGLADVSPESLDGSISFIVSAFLPQMVSSDTRLNEQRADQSKIQNPKSKIAWCSSVGLRLSKSSNLRGGKEDARLAK